MLAERPPLFFLAFLGLFVLALTVATMALHETNAIRSPAFALLVGFGAILGLGEALSAFLIAHPGRAGAGSARGDGPIAEERRRRVLRIATWGMLAVAPAAGAALGLAWPMFRNLLR